MAIVGAGAAGLATAIFVRRLNASRSVVLLDGAKKPGAKILISGGSRCNVTNASVTERDFWGGRPAIVRRVLGGFPVHDTIAFFEQMGVRLHEEADGKLFPNTNRSRDVLDALLREVQAVGAALHAECRVLAVTPMDGRFDVQTSRGLVHAAGVVLATGGRSLPKTGSDGLGIEIARGLGHRIVPPTPALVPLLLAGGDEALHRDLAGVSQPVELSVWIDGRVAARLEGALLWTHFGISGPVALNASRHWIRAREEGRSVAVTVNFCRGEPFDAVDRQLTALSAQRPNASIQHALASFVPARVAATLLARLRIDGGMARSHFSRADRRRLAHALVEWPLAIVGTRGYNFAEVTAGGVALDEIDPSTMESRVCPGLWLVGEMLDVDGRIGGFNFQWSWASARVAAAALASSG